MVVKTQTETVETLRKGVLELLLLNHPLDCPVCDKGGECPLQDQTYTYGPSTSRSIDDKARKLKAADLGNFIVLDRERCIMCRRCTRFDDEIAMENNLVVSERADGAIITTATGERYNSYFSGNTIELCPVGALTSDVYRFKARPWDLAKVPSICTGCSVGCNTRLDYRFGELMRVVSRENPNVDDGWLCDRGRFNYKFVTAENRLQTPMLRVDGQLTPVSWSRAMSAIAERLQAVRKTSGPKAIGVIGGGKLTNEEAYLLGKLARAGLGTSNLDFRVGDQVVASNGAHDGAIVDVDQADVVLIVDTLVAERAPVLDLRIRKRARKGGRIISVGSVHGEYRTSAQTISALPGEVASALGNADLVAQLKDAGRLVVVWGGHDADLGRAIDTLIADVRAAGKEANLLILSEQVNSRGAEWVGLHPALLPGGRLVTDAKSRAQVEKAWGAAVPEQVGLSTDGMLKAAATGSLQALLLFGANLKQTYPNGEVVDAALKKAFVVAVDLFTTETVEYADVVLPAASFPAKVGSYTTLDGQVQQVEPANAPEFDTWTDGQIITALAEILQIGLYESDAAMDREMELLGCAPAAGRYGGLNAEAFAKVLADGTSPSTASGSDLVLVPVERLFAGGGTAHFDAAIAHARPQAEGYIHPTDAAGQGIRDGDMVAIDAGDQSLHVQVKVKEFVARGTLQVVAGLPGTDVFGLMRAGQHPRVRVNRGVMEEVV